MKDFLITFVTTSALFALWSIQFKLIDINSTLQQILQVLKEKK